MTWLRANWRWAALNLCGVFVLTLVLSQGSTDWNATDAFDPGLESGKWAIRFLLICLAMTPLNTYFGWRSMIGLRKPAGLWAFGFAGLHLLVYVQDAGWAWLTWPIQPFIALGLLGLLILTALALTSNRWAMRRLRKNWKRLHRLVYLAGSAGATHAILASSASKKIFLRDPQAIHELKVYLAVLVVLLVVRLPLVRRGLKRILILLRPQRPVERPTPALHLPTPPHLPRTAGAGSGSPPGTGSLRTDASVIPLTIADTTPEYWSQGYGREVGVPLDDLIATVQTQEDYVSRAIQVNNH